MSARFYPPCSRPSSMPRVFRLPRHYHFASFLFWCLQLCGWDTGVWQYGRPSKMTHTPAPEGCVLAIKSTTTQF